VLLGLVGGIISLAVRYRRARGVERQQVTWLLYGAVVAACILSFDDFLPVDVAFPISFALPALTIGVAVLRYRLYDIDRIVSRTVAYGVLTALLAVPYLVVVTFASRVGGSNDLAVAVATLAAAAAFNPLRRRVQHRVDRLFNRARYDAGRTVEAFSHRLREEVDLRSVHEDLLAVVRQTVEPSSASLWLRQRP
jgi:peptidoglycan/LPS O-acetylase OafA/YrhL